MFGSVTFVDLIWWPWGVGARWLLLPVHLQRSSSPDKCGQVPWDRAPYGRAFGTLGVNILISLVYSPIKRTRVITNKQCRESMILNFSSILVIHWALPGNTDSIQSFREGVYAGEGVTGKLSRLGKYGGKLVSVC